MQKCHWFATHHLCIASIDKNTIKHLCTYIDTYDVMGRQIRLGRHIEGKMQTRFSRIWIADKRKQRRIKYQQMHAPAGSGACVNVRTSWV